MEEERWGGEEKAWRAEERGNGEEQEGGGGEKTRLCFSLAGEREGWKEEEEVEVG